MKANNLLYIIRWGNEKQQLKLIYALACVSLIAMMIVFIPSDGIDTPSYYKAGETFLNGKIDSFRTPVYPILCALTLRLEHFIAVIPSLSQLIMVILQLAFYLISVRYFYRLCALFLSEKAVLFAATALYATLPGFSLFSFNVLTESFAQSWFIIFCYYTLMFIRSHELLWSIKSNLLLLVLLLLRPAFIFILPIGFLSLIYFAFKKTRNIMVHSIGLICIVLVILVYCQWYKSAHGVFSISSVSNFNQLVVMQNEGFLDNCSIDSPYVKILTTTKETIYIPYKISKISPKQKHTIVKNILQKHGKEYLQFSLKKFIKLGGIHMHKIWVHTRMGDCCLIISLLTEYLSPTFYYYCPLKLFVA